MINLTYYLMGAPIILEATGEVVIPRKGDHILFAGKLLEVQTVVWDRGNNEVRLYLLPEPIDTALPPGSEPEMPKVPA